MGRQVTYGVIDLETTGLRAHDAIVEIACLSLDGAGTVLHAFDTIVNPKRSPGPTWLHGITMEMCDEAPTFDEVAGTIHDLVAGQVLVAHRLRFDWSMLRRAFHRVGASFLREAQGICTATMAADAGMAGGLQRVARTLGVEVRRPHRALDDALTTREVWLRLRADSPLDGGHPLPPASGAHRLARSRSSLSRAGMSSGVPSAGIGDGGRAHG